MPPTRERKLNFKQLLLLTLTLHFVRARCADIFMLLLATRQEVAKKPDFGKPKSQVCLFAKREHRASAGANIAANTEDARKQES